MSQENYCLMFLSLLCGPFLISLSLSDVADRCSIKQCVERVGSLVGAGGLNLLINNAAVLFHGTIQSTSPEDMLTTFTTNVLGPMSLTKVRDGGRKFLLLYLYIVMVLKISSCMYKFCAIFVCNI